MGQDRAKLRWNGWGWTARKDDVAGREDVWTWLAAELGMPALLATPARPLEELTLPPSKLAPQDRAFFTGVVGEGQVRDSAYERAFHARGRSYHDLLHLRSGDLSTAPDAVLYPRGQDEVAAILAFAAQRLIAIVPFGGGTSVVGGVTGARADFISVITLDLSEMDRMIEIDTLSGTATVEAGISGPALENALKAKGLTLGHTPQSFEFSTLGGWIAHRSAGQASNLTGGPQDWLIGAKLATPRGVLDTGAAPVPAAGPDLKAFIVGSEGAFGVITEATVRLRRLPDICDYRGYLFRDFESGAAAIRTAMQNDCSAAMLRLSDAEETRFLQTFSGLGKKKSITAQLTQQYRKLRGYSGRPCLLIAGFEGDEQTVTTARKRFTDIARRYSMLALGPSPGEQWRQSRFQMPYLRDPLLDRGVGVDIIETAASWSKLPALMAAVRTALDEAIRQTVPREGARGVVMSHLSHATSDGACLCFTVVFPRALHGDIEQWKAITAAAADAVLANGGALSPHHGIGEDHLAWMGKEKGEPGLDALRAVKRALDPDGILNPGKLIP